MTAVAIRGTTYPIVLPKLRDPRLHLAATITSLQVLGQVAFDFKLSIAQILICLGTVAVLEVGITARKQHVLMWPASALLTGNGVAFVLRVPGTVHGDWWSLKGWWIFLGTSAGALLSKYVIAWRGEHVFNPSNIGLVAVFLILGRRRAEPLDFWWGPMSWWMVLALVIIVSGGFLILRRLKLLRVALSFWAAFAIGIAGLALAGHTMLARWHLGPITGFYFWWVLVTSPEVLVFFFFMITDPKTAPKGPRARIVYGIALGLLASMMIAPTTTEFAAKVALLSSLALVCLAKAVTWFVPIRVDRTRLVAAAAVGLAAYVGVVAFANNSRPAYAAPVLPPGTLPAITILPSPGVQSPLDRKTAEQIAYALVAARPAHQGDTLRIHLVPGSEQSPPTALAQLASATYRLHQTATGAWALSARAAQQLAAPTPQSNALAGSRLTDVAPLVGLDFQQGSFRFGVSNDVKAMMGGGVCWIDYNGDGRLDLFAVNSYSSDDVQQWEAQGGLPTSQLFENVGNTFKNVTEQAHAGLAVQGDGCAAADLNGDGRTDLVVSTTTGVDVLWNTGKGFTEGTLPAPSGWYTGIAIADVNHDGRPDVFVAGYSDPNEPVPGSTAGFPTNIAAVRDLLFLNDGARAFREVGVAAGLEAAGFRHGLGAQFLANGDLYVANDEDPNDLYVNVPWPGGKTADPAGLGFRFEERAASAGVADPFAGMGIAALDRRLFVTNSRGEPSAAYVRAGSRYLNVRPLIDPALGTGFAGWGASWVDLQNTGRPNLVLTAGAIPVTNLKRNAEPVRVLAPTSGSKFGDDRGVLAAAVRLNGRGLAAADANNDGRMQIAINTIGGRLVLLRPSGPSGHWLDVKVSPFLPGTVVTVVLANGSVLSREVTAGSSYLSSEDPRLHFGLGAETGIERLAVRFPSGQTWGLDGVAGAAQPVDRVITVVGPTAHRPARPSVNAALPGCTPVTHGRSVARIWNDTAVAALRAGGASEPVQARDLYDLSTAVAQAYAGSHSPAAVSYAAYRVLLWQASFNANLDTTFGVLTKQLRALCYSPAYTGGVGNRIALAAIRANAHDGANESLHFADPTFTPRNQPLIVAQAGSTVHDATFWQPLALAQVSPRGSGAVPASVQAFIGSHWGAVRTFAGKVPVGAPALGDPSGKAYRDAAIGAIRATAEQFTRSSLDPSPAGWNAGLPSLGLARDVKVDLALNAALNDAAVSVFGAKRRYESPRPISMIRYLAFNGQLPIRPGLTRRAGNRTEVRSQGRWVDGARWTPPLATPASPGYPSADAAFAAAADAVLTKLTGHSYAVRDEQASALASQAGIELEADTRAGRAVGAQVATRVLAR